MLHIKEHTFSCVQALSADDPWECRFPCRWGSWDCHVSESGRDQSLSSLSNSSVHHTKQMIPMHWELKLSAKASLGEYLGGYGPHGCMIRLFHHQILNKCAWGRSRKNILMHVNNLSCILYNYDVYLKFYHLDVEFNQIESLIPSTL